jgi:hypothetical protein
MPSPLLLFSVSALNSSFGCRYLGNLHPAVTPAVLQEICSNFGNLIHVKVIKVSHSARRRLVNPRQSRNVGAACPQDRITGASAGYGFAKFSTKGSAANALAFLHRKQLFGLEVSTIAIIQSPLLWSGCRNYEESVWIAANGPADPCRHVSGVQCAD